MKKIIFLLLCGILSANEKVFIKGGDFIIPHSNSFYLKHIKKRKIHLKSFYIDKYEVSYNEIKKFDPQILKNRPQSIYFSYNQPVTSISYKEALKFCRFKGGDLPTENQWIVAAAFENGKFYKYPTKTYPVDKNNNFFDDFVNVNKAFKGINGLYGMFGNVWEMVKSKGEYVLIKGGSFVDYDRPYLMDVRIRNYVLKKYLKLYEQIGFRCVYKGK